jgi:signal transduction histidine kinase
MIKPVKHKNEEERIKLLQSYCILDTEPEIDFENLTTIAAQICNVPIALISLLDDKRQWFKSHYGLNAAQTHKDISFCAHAINQSESILIIEDARKDERFHDNPLVTDEPFVIFYAGVVLVNEHNLPFGTLCVIDHKPRKLSEVQIKSLRAIANQVVFLMENRKNKILLEAALKQVEEKNIELEKFAFLTAHDLKSPLNNLISILTMLSEDYPAQMDLEASDLLQFGLDSSNKLKELIDGVLNYTLSPELLQQDKILLSIETIKKDMETFFYAENNCHLSLKTNLTAIRTNKIAFEQILINLVANAIKYCDKEVAAIVIEIEENETHYEVFVKDNGSGISTKDQKKIFQLFETLSVKDKYGNSGNGIGLATVKNLVEHLGGQINIDSKKGRGTVFSFTLEKSTSDLIQNQI